MTFHDVDSIDPDTAIRSGATHHEQDIDEAEYAESRASEPLTEEEDKALAEHLGGDSGPDLLAFQGTPRNPVQQIPGAWIHPMKRQARLNAVRIGRVDPNYLDQQIASVMRFGGAPAPVEKAARAARDAVQKLRDVLAQARHPDQPAFAISPEGKQAIEREVARAKLAISRLEGAAVEHADEWYAALTHGLDEKRQKAERAVRAAEKAYTDWASSRAGAHALAEHQGRFAGGWHNSPLVREIGDPTAAIGTLGKVRKIVSSDDHFMSGAYLAAEYDGVPPHTIAHLEKRAEATQHGSFARQIAWRAKANRSDDPDLQQAIAKRDLRILNNAAPLGFRPSERED